jgi:hypothetical protein
MIPPKGIFYILRYCLISSFFGITCIVAMISVLGVFILIINTLSDINIFLS